MTNLTISLSDEIVRRLRRTVRDRYNGKKGAMSGLIEESLREKLDTFEVSLPLQTFKAVKNNHVIAEAEDLKALARKLEEFRVDPRSVSIISSRKLAQVVRSGLHGREH